jgi:HEAT repeats
MNISRTVRISFFLVVLLAGSVIWLLCVIFQPFGPKEPQYQGKKLTDWAGEITWVNQGIFFDHLISTNQEQGVRAISAIRHIGTNALPVALELCGAKDSWPRKQLVEWVEQYDGSHWPKSFPIHPKPDWEKNSEGVSIIWALGPMAEPAIPVLIQLLQSRDWDTAETAMMALPGIGTNAIPSLVQLLASSNQGTRVRAATILAQSFTSQAHEAVPVLLDCLNVKKYPKLDSVTRLRAIYSLSFIKQDAPVIVGAMIHHIQSDTNNLTFKNPDFIVLRDCFGALGNFSTNAEPAVQLLVNIIESDPQFPNPKWPGFSGMALGTLKRIDPEAAHPFLERWNAVLTNSSLLPIKRSHQQRTTEPAYQGRPN